MKPTGYPSRAWLYLLPIAYGCAIASVLELVDAQWLIGAAAAFAAVALAARSVQILVNNRRVRKGDEQVPGTPE